MNLTASDSKIIQTPKPSVYETDLSTQTKNPTNVGVDKIFIHSEAYNVSIIQ